MMRYISITIVLTLSLGALMTAQNLGVEVKPVKPVIPHPYPCFDIALEKTANRTCIGHSCQRRCLGNCKTRCGTNEAVGVGYCGNRCKCCQPVILPCQHGTRCGSGGKCRGGITCPRGEKPISGICESSKRCICCAPTTEETCAAPFKQIGAEYFYFHDSSKVNWDEALSHCKSIGGSLAEPANMDDFLTLIETSYSHMKYDIWLGATDRSTEQDWKWLSGGSVPNTLWPVWPGNQPSGDGDCMQIHYHGYSGFFLNDYYCRVKGYFVCECTPQITTGCSGACSTRRGSGYCKDACNRGEERLGSCPGGKCSCCSPRVSPRCGGMCTLRGGQMGFCSRNCLQHSGLETVQKSGLKTDLRLSLIPAPKTCNIGCRCCSFGIKG